MFGNGVKISAKLPIVLVSLVLVALLAQGLVAYTRSASQLVEASEEKLLALMKARKGALDSYLASIREDIVNMSENAQMVEAALEFQYATEFLRGGFPRLIKGYVTENPHPPGERHKLDKADGTRYSKTHKLHHPVLRRFMQRRGYQDILLIDAKANVVYSVHKGPEYATNLNDGPWKESVVADVFRTIHEKVTAELKKAEESGEELNGITGYNTVTDFQPYSPDEGVPAGFIAGPMMDGSEFLGVLVFRMPVGRINDVMQDAVGLGKQGETYLVGSDMLMRSDSRFSKTSTLLKTKVDTEAARRALAGKTGVDDLVDHKGVRVLAAYIPLEFSSIKWALLAEAPRAEVLAPVAEMRVFMLGGGLVILLFASVIGVVFARRIAGSIGRMTAATSKLAHGDLDVEVPGRHRRDEIGEMGAAVQIFKDNAIKLKQMAAEQQALHRRSARKLRSEMLALTNALDEEVQGAVGMVMDQSETMKAAAVDMARAVEQVEDQAGSASSASGTASSSVDAVAAAAEELTNSISEIGQLVEKSTGISQAAVEEVANANTKVQGLADAAQKIGEVVSLITDIAEQTNLLALNATIEAARAGDAGKGFAVVASEVKNLANQTAKATEEIGSQIGGIQAATKEAVVAIKSIGSTIEEMSSIATTIAAAVEEQHAATGNISNNAHEAAAGTQQASVNIQEVSRSTSETGRLSQDVQHSANEVSERVQQMHSTLIEIMRAGSDSERRVQERHTVNVAAKVTIGGQAQTCLLQDIAIAGAGVVDRSFGVERGTEFDIEIPGLQPMKGAVVASTDRTTHIRLDLTEALMRDLEAFIEKRGASRRGGPAE